MNTSVEYLDALAAALPGDPLREAASLEERVLAALDPHEGTESFNLPGPSPWKVRSALQRLRAKGLAEAVRCPDGAWVWFSLVDPS